MTKTLPGEVRVRRSVTFASAVLVVGLIVTACGSGLVPFRLSGEPPVPPDAIQPPLDGDRPVRPPGEEDLPYLDFSRPGGAAA